MSESTVIDYTELLDNLHNDFHVLTTSVDTLKTFALCVVAIVFLIFIRDLIWR